MVVQHQSKLHCFTAHVNGSLAKLEYSLSGDTVTFISTYVPFRLRGQGIAEQIVDTGLKWARQQGLNISTTCWYVEKFLNGELNHWDRA